MTNLNVFVSSDSTFWVKMTQFFSLSAPREKMSHLDLENGVTSGTKI